MTPSLKPDGKPDVTLIGAGPVGSLLALALAQRGLSVEVFERRPDMRTHAISAGRSINLAVSRRGLHALGLVGLDQAVLDHTVPMLGRMVHPLDPTAELKLLRYGRDDSEHISSMSRGGLNQLLMTEAEKTGKVRIHFDQRVLAMNFTKKLLTICDENSGKHKEIPVDVLIGTDGSASAIRHSLQEVGAQVVEDRLSAGYKELTMPAQLSGPHQPFAMHPQALHIWPRGQFMLIALPNPEGTFTCTLFLPLQSQVSPSFQDLQTPEQIQHFFVKWFPDFVPLVPDLLEQFQHAPLGHMVTVKTWPWTHEMTALCGDAAHAIVPFFGQGMNAGFEDVAVLMDLLDHAPRPLEWPTILQEFAQQRKPDTDAIADLAVENFVEMRDKVADPNFLLQRAVEAEIDKRLAGFYRSRYQLVTFTRVPYRVALQAGQIQAGVLGEVCAGKTQLAEVDVDLAEQLMRERLLPMLASQHLEQKQD